MLHMGKKNPKARISTIKTIKKQEEQRQRISTIASVIGQMVMELDKNNVNLSEQFETTIFGMEDRINSDIMQFNLLQEEEAALLESVKSTINEASQIFEKSVASELQYRSIMTELLGNLDSLSRSSI